MPVGLNLEKRCACYSVKMLHFIKPVTGEAKAAVMCANFFIVIIIVSHSSLLYYDTIISDNQISKE